MANNLIVNAPKPINSMNFTPPKIGVINPPSISKTPLADTLKRKEQERKSDAPPKVQKKKNTVLRVIDALQAGVALIGVGFLWKKLSVVLKKIK